MQREHDGVTVFDAGIRSMAGAIRARGAVPAWIAIDGGEVRIGPPFEADRGLGPKAEPPSRPEDSSRLEVGALDQDPRGPLADLGRLGPHDPGQRHSTLKVCDQEVLRRQRAGHTVQGHHSLTVVCPADDDPRPFETGEIEGAGGGWAYVLSDLKSLLETGEASA